MRLTELTKPAEYANCLLYCPAGLCELTLDLRSLCFTGSMSFLEGVERLIGEVFGDAL